MKFLKNLFPNKKSSDNGIYTAYNEKIISSYIQKNEILHVEEIRLPAITGSQNAKVTKWHKNEGDKIEAGEIVCTLESKQSKMEIEAFRSGILGFKTPLHQQLRTNDVLFLLFISKEQ
jgi:hypothetical protein